MKCFLCEKVHKNEHKAKSRVQCVYLKINEKCLIRGILYSKNYVTQHIKTDYDGKNYPCTFCRKELTAKGDQAEMHKWRNYVCNSWTKEKESKSVILQ